MNFYFYSKYNGKSTIEQLKRVTFFVSSSSFHIVYLGHKSFNETQKYIWMTPIIFEDIKNKMEEYSRFIMDIFGGEKFDEDE